MRRCDHDRTGGSWAAADLALGGVAGVRLVATCAVCAGLALAWADAAHAQNRNKRAAYIENPQYIANLDADFPFSDMIGKLTSAGCAVPYEAFESAFNTAARSARKPNVRKGGGTHIARAELPALRKRGLVEFVTPDGSTIRIRHMGGCP